MKENDKKDTINRAVSLEIESVHPEIGAMSKEILSHHPFEQLLHNFHEAAALAHWASDIIQQMENKGLIADLRNYPQDPNQQLAYRLGRQRVIFGIKAGPLSRF